MRIFAAAGSPSYLRIQVIASWHPDDDKQGIHVLELDADVVFCSRVRRMPAVYLASRMSFTRACIGAVYWHHLYLKWVLGQDSGPPCTACETRELCSHSSCV